MANEKKYYYLKLKDNFFDSDEMILLENMPDGYLYSNILLKLYLRSLKNNGKLMVNDKIPYSINALAQATRHKIIIIKKALPIFQKLGLVEVLDSGAIYMLDIQNFIGESSTEADRKRIYRQNIAEEKGSYSGHLSIECPDKTTPEIRDKSIEIRNKSLNNKDKDTKADKPPVTTKKKFIKPSVLEIALYCQERKNNIDAESFIDYYEAKGWMVGKSPMKDWQATVRNWERNDQGGKQNGNKCDRANQPCEKKEQYGTHY